MLRARHFFAFLSEPACRRFFVARVSRPVMVRTRVGRPVPRPDDRLQACLLQLKPTEASFGASDPTANETPHRRQSLPASPAKHARANAIGNKSAPPLYYWIPSRNLAHCPPTYCQSSSVVEQRTHNSESAYFALLQKLPKLGFQRRNRVFAFPTISEKCIVLGLACRRPL